MIQELKDLKFVGSQPTRSMNGMSKSIEEVLKFLSVLAMTEVNLKNKLPAAMEFNNSQQSELKMYLKEVESLLRQNGNKQEMEEEEEESKDELQETKKRP